jgi:N6-adenosine-specific RNA methylase IME4
MMRMANVFQHELFPQKRYPIIYADPPWAWSKRPLINRGSARAVEKEYPTMQPDEIKALPVQEIAEDRAVLFLWATSPKLPLALDVMAAWGFRFVSVAFVWVKRNKVSHDSWFTGMGFYTRQNAEFVLLGTRGSPSLVRNDKGVHQIVDEPISIHSRKPSEVRHRIDRLFDGDRIELFARESAVGWDRWGFESPPDDLITSRIPACTIDTVNRVNSASAYFEPESQDESQG